MGRFSGPTPGAQQQPAEQQATQNQSRQRLRQAPPGGKKTEFHGARQPPISIDDYLRRIAKYAKCSPVCFVMAHTYIERLAQVPDGPSSEFSRSRLAASEDKALR